MDRRASLHKSRYRGLRVSAELRRELLAQAVAARARAYAPYSHYTVGAAVLGASGRIFSGCNVENASYGLTVCAERIAIFKGISEGETEFLALAVVTANAGSPCGACRQVQYEFMSPTAPVYLAGLRGRRVLSYTVRYLLPDGFSPRKLRQGQTHAANQNQIKTKK